MRASALFRDFFNSEKSSGIVLIICTIVSLCLANFIVGEPYLAYWHQHLDLSIGSLQLNLSLEHWINDGLMTIFFLLVGLEIERELYSGELSSIKNASLPIIAAIGGMAIPALLHYTFNAGTATQSGFGIPMATDIAFALGVLALVGKRIPLSLKIFLAALAIIDDLGAILIIAIFYTSGIQAGYLFAALGIALGLLIMNRLKVYQLRWYLLGGVLMWYCMLQSGVHATISGVLLAFVIPFQEGNKTSISYRLQHALHKPVAFIIVPLFALANTGIIISGGADTIFMNRNSIGIIVGLVVGKPLGILLICFLAVKLKLARLPQGVNWLQLVGAGILAGIGFTMSIFISLLAFENSTVINHAKIAVLVSSVIAGVIGFIWLRRATVVKDAED